MGDSATVKSWPVKTISDQSYDGVFMGFKSVIYNVYNLTHASLMDHETGGSPLRLQGALLRARSCLTALLHMR